MVFPCYGCFEHFQEESQRKRHRIKNHPNHFTSSGICLLCGETVSNLFEFRDHFAEAHTTHFNRLIENVANKTTIGPEEVLSQIWIVITGFKPVDEESDVKLIMAANDLEINEKLLTNTTNGNDDVIDDIMDEEENNEIVDAVEELDEGNEKSTNEPLLLGLPSAIVPSPSLLASIDTPPSTQSLPLKEEIVLETTSETHSSSTSIESNPIFAPFSLWLKSQPGAASLDTSAVFTEFTDWQERQASKGAQKELVPEMITLDDSDSSLQEAPSTTSSSSISSLVVPPTISSLGTSISETTSGNIGPSSADSVIHAGPSDATHGELRDEPNISQFADTIPIGSQNDENQPSKEAQSGFENHTESQRTQQMKRSLDQTIHVMAPLKKAKTTPLGILRDQSTTPSKTPNASSTMSNSPSATNRGYFVTAQSPTEFVGKFDATAYINFTHRQTQLPSIFNGTGNLQILFTSILDGESVEINKKNSSIVNLITNCGIGWNRSLILAHHPLLVEYSKKPSSEKLCYFLLRIMVHVMRSRGRLGEPVTILDIICSNAALRAIFDKMEQFGMSVDSLTYCVLAMSDIIEWLKGHESITRLGIRGIMKENQIMLSEYLTKYALLRSESAKNRNLVENRRTLTDEN